MYLESRIGNTSSKGLGISHSLDNAEPDRMAGAEPAGTFNAYEHGSSDDGPGHYTLWHMESLSCGYTQPRGSDQGLS
jgi:hypothetical protein